MFLWSATLLTAGTAVWYYRKSITTSASNLVLGGVLPGLGAAFMAFVIIYSLASGALNGIQIGFGFGFAVLGLILSFVARKVSGSDLYTDRSARGGSGCHRDTRVRAADSPRRTARCSSRAWLRSWSRSGSWGSEAVAIAASFRCAGRPATPEERRV